MLGEVFIVRYRLLNCQETELLICGCVLWIAIAMISVLEDNAKTIGRIHQDLYDASLQVRKS